MQEAAKEQGTDVYQLLNSQLDALTEKLEFPALLTKQVHVLPYFNGNRSPRANPLLVGDLFGLQLSNTPEDLARIYLATIQTIAYGARHIVEEMNAQSYQIETIIATGGGDKEYDLPPGTCRYHRLPEYSSRRAGSCAPGERCPRCGGCRDL